MAVYKFHLTDTAPRTRAEIISIINQLKAIEASLLETAMKSVLSGNHLEYEIDTGQTKQRVKYTSPVQVTAALEYYDKLIQRYSNKLLKRTFTLVDSRNFYRK